jgi:hypothetical protein
MGHITLTKVKDPSSSRWLRAVSSDYNVPRNSQVFWGWGLHDDRVAVWVGEDGRGFGALDRDPEGYIALSEAVDRDDLDFESNHPGVDEWEFEPGTFDPSAEAIELDVRSSLF